MNSPKVEVNIPEDYRDVLYKIVKTFHDSGKECYLVGGSVRDMILGINVYDFDFATNARPETVKKLFKKVIPTGIKHGTVSIIIDRKTYEVTTYRSDGKYIDGRRPSSVEFSDSLFEDVKRRDFTINGLAYDIISNEVIDYVDGLSDIMNGVIRTIGDPAKRFSEDGLRPMRACRFAAKLNFRIDDDTFEAIKNTHKITEMVSIERVRDEIVKMLNAEKPSIGFEYMRKCGLLKIFIPELDECFGITQNRFHKYDIYYHSIYSCDASPPGDTAIRLSALLHDIGKFVTRNVEKEGEATFYNHEVVGAGIARKLMRRLKFSNEITARVINMIKNHMFHYVDNWTDGAVRRFIRKVGLENIDDLFIVRMADRKGSGMRNGLPEPVKVLKKRIAEVIEKDNAFTVRDLDINGNDLMDEFNIKPGPVIGKILNELLEMVLDEPELNNREILLENARKIYKTIIE